MDECGPGTGVVPEGQQGRQQGQHLVVVQVVAVVVVVVAAAAAAAVVVVVVVVAAGQLGQLGLEQAAKLGLELGLELGLGLRRAGAGAAGSCGSPRLRFLEPARIGVGAAGGCGAADGGRL